MTKTNHYGKLTEGHALSLRKRRHAEFRLKAYGIAAITAAGLALFSLIGSVIMQASGAITESYVTLPVILNAEDIDPDGNRDPKKILRADFGKLTKSTLRDAFPEVKSRGGKRELYDVVSSGAAFELADKVSADTSLVGQTIDFRFLASDVTDLYLKGSFGRLDTLETIGTLNITLDKKTATITSSADDFADVLVQVKTLLVDDAKRLRRLAARQNNAVSVYKAQLANAETDNDKAKIQKKLDKVTKKRDGLLAEAADLEDRAKSVGGNEELDDENRSFFIRTNNAWLKLTSVTTNGAEALIMKPPSGDIAQVET